ncbi:hypothetical protein CN918_29045 [Priestia megaterium]|nr:hypothetical protein CN918_29045 [Priestia megaterium]
MEEKNETVLTSQEMGKLLFELASRATAEFIEELPNTGRDSELTEGVLFTELIGLVMFVLQEYRPRHIPVSVFGHMYFYYDKALREETAMSADEVDTFSTHYKVSNREYEELLQEKGLNQQVEALKNHFIKRVANVIDLPYSTYNYFDNLRELLTKLIKSLPFILADYEVQAEEEHFSRSTVGSTTRQETKRKRLGWTKRPLAIFFSIAGVILIYIIVNAILIGVQNMSHSDEKAQLEKYKTELKEEKEDILSAEEELKAVQAKAESLKEEVDGYEIDYPQGIPEELYGDYEMLVDEYNGLVDEFDTMNIDYEDQIEGYNKKVETANDLAEEVGSTWYIVPVGKK